MKKLIAIALLTLTLGGCATAQRIEQGIATVTGLSVSPTQIVVAGNAFDAAEVGAANYLTFCKTNKVLDACALVIRKRVMASVRAGRVARDALEPYVTSGKAGPIVIYNALIEAVSAIKGNTPAVGAAK